MKSCVLVMADDVAERASIARALQTGGHSVELAEDAKRALRLTKGRKFGAAIVAMSSGPAAEAIVRELRGAFAKVIAVVDPVKQGVRPDHAFFPADAFLSRPLDQRQLLASIAELEDSSQELDVNGAPNVFGFEGGTFDALGRTFVDFDRAGNATNSIRSRAIVDLSAKSQAGAVARSTASRDRRPRHRRL